MAESASPTVAVAVTSKPCISKIWGSVIRMLGSTSTSRIRPFLISLASLCGPSHHAGSDSALLLVHGNFDDFFLYGVSHQLRFVVNIELAHQIELMRLDGLDTQAQQNGDFLH